MRSAVLIVILMAGVAHAAAPASRGLLPPDPCRLLAAEDIQTVQGSVLKDRKGSSERVTSLEYRQCFFTAADFVRSVSLTVITASESAPAGATRAYWEKTFRPAPKAAPTSGRIPRKKDPPRPIEGLGGESFWTGDPRTGALYVMDGDVVLRISIGGVADEDERLRRSVALARTALRRLKAPAS